MPLVQLREHAEEVRRHAVQRGALLLHERVDDRGWVEYGGGVDDGGAV